MKCLAETLRAQAMADRRLAQRLSEQAVVCRRPCQQTAALLEEAAVACLGKADTLELRADEDERRRALTAEERVRAAGRQLANAEAEAAAERVRRAVRERSAVDPLGVTLDEDPAGRLGEPRS